MDTESKKPESWYVQLIIAVVLLMLGVYGMFDQFGYINRSWEARGSDDWTATTATIQTVNVSDEGDFEPWLAESWEESEDGLSLTLHLRQGIMFHNGREMTADDVVWSAEHAMDESYGHHLSDRFKLATGAEKIDVRINLCSARHLIVPATIVDRMMDPETKRFSHIGRTSAQTMPEFGTGHFDDAKRDTACQLCHVSWHELRTKQQQQQQQQQQ